jgi:hypothetical protein
MTAKLNTTAIALALVEKDYTILKELLKDYHPTKEATKEEMRVKKMKILEILELLQ